MLGTILGAERLKLSRPLTKAKPELLLGPTWRLAGLADHRLNNRKAARPNEAPAHIALGIRDDSSGQFGGEIC
jgi:hypothetical protein